MILWQDARQALRLTARAPGFSILAALVAGLGVGAAGTVFAVVDAVLLNPLPFPEPERLVMVHSLRRATGEEGVFSFPDFADVADESESFDALSAVGEESLILGREDGARRVAGELVTPAYFAILGAEPALGRSFTGNESEPVVLSSHEFFRNELGGDAAVLGAPLEINGSPFVLVGVLPPGFHGLSGGADLWVPLLTFDVLHPELTEYEILDNRGIRWLSVVGRLAGATSRASAEAELDALARALEAEFPRANEGRGISLRPAYDEIVGGVESSVVLLAGAVGLLLLLTCANLANLFLGRVLSRQSELHLRLALGATRVRLARQLLTESALVGLLGGALGILVARVGLTGLESIAPVELPGYVATRLDVRVVGFTLLVALATGLLFGLLPVVATARRALASGDRSGIRGARTESGLALAEIALSTVLLVGTGLVGHSFLQMQRFAPGFDPSGLLTLHFYLPPSEGSDTLERVRERARSVPGVQEAAVASHLYFGDGYMSGDLTVEGYEPPSPEDELRTYRHYVSPGYFEAMGLPLLRGRAFDAEDGAESPGVAIVNASFAEQMWPGEDPLGQRVKLGEERNDEGWLTVVGVASDVRPTLRAERGGDLPQLYLPIAQGGGWSRALVVRTTLEPAAIVPALARELQGLDRGIAVYDAVPMETLLARSRATARYVSSVMGAFAALSLLLAAVGLYGVLSLAVKRSTREMGVRLALGAERRSLVGLVLRRTFLVTATGIALGLALSLALGRTLASLLYEISPLDSATYAFVVATVVTAVLFASVLPAFRAASVDPIRALRHE